MKKFKHIFSLMLLISCLACGSKTPTSSESNKKIEQEVNTLLNDWHQAAADADFNKYFSSIASNGYYIGTDESEVWTKSEFAAFSKPFFDKGRAWDFKVIKRQIKISGGKDIVWFNETLNTWMGVCRGSGVLQYDGELKKYLIREYVLSLTVPNDKMREVIDVIEN